MKPFEARRLGSMRKHILDNIPDETKRIMFANHMTTMHEAHVLAGGNPDRPFETVDATIGTRRRQAIQAFPVFAKTLMKRNARQKIDDGASVKSVLVDQFRVPPKIINRLQGVTWQKAGREAAQDPHVMIHHISDIDVNHIPKDRKQWANLRFARRVIEDYTASNPGASQADTMKSLGGRFDIIAKYADDYAPGGIEDMQRYVTNTLVAPAAAAGMAARGINRGDIKRVMKDYDPQTGQSIVRCATQSLMATQNMRKQLDLSNRFHRNIHRYDAKIRTFVSTSTWDPLQGEVDLGGGITAIELCSDHALRAEGLKQDHCVGGYGDAVMSGQSLIYSLRKDGEILSTVEYDPGQADQNGRKKPVLVQNMARRNGKSSGPALRLKKNLRRHLGKVVKEDWRRYDAGLDEIHHAQSADARLGEVQRNAGFDYLDKAAARNSWDELSVYLPKAHQKAGLAAFQSAMADQVLAQQTQSRRLTSFHEDVLPQWEL